MTVKRYFPSQAVSEHLQETMTEDSRGTYVLASDYDKLNKLGNEVAEVLGDESLLIMIGATSLRPKADSALTKWKEATE